MSRPPYTDISVVMPYYENQRTLPACLDSFCRQTLQPKEIIVVDDGSTHPAAALVAAQPWPVPVRLFSSAHGGQSAATNVGIQAAQGTYTLLTCADILADTALVAEHASAHAQAAGEDLAVMGNLPYADSVPMTPFMRWLCMPARQFSFALIRDPENVPPKYCYAPNISLRSAILQEMGGFDEKFVYGYQDTDLGFRLGDKQIRFVYRAAAIGYHDHPTSVRRFAKRQFQIGEATLTMLEKYPDPEQKVRFANIVQKYRGYVGKLPTMLDDIEKLEQRIARLPGTERRLPEPLVNLYDFAMVLAMVDGILTYPQRMQRVFADAEQWSSGTAGASLPA